MIRRGLWLPKLGPLPNYKSAMSRFWRQMWPERHRRDWPTPFKAAGRSAAPACMTVNSH